MCVFCGDKKINDSRVNISEQSYENEMIKIIKNFLFVVCVVLDDFMYFDVYLLVVFLYFGIVQFVK